MKGVLTACVYYHSGYEVVDADSKEAIEVLGHMDALGALEDCVVTYECLESMPPKATNIELYVPQVEIKRFPSNKKELEKILMDLSYAISQGTYGGCSTHQHVVSLFMKDQGYE